MIRKKTDLLSLRDIHYGGNMKKYFLGLLILASALPAFAEPTAPRPCQVVAVDRYHRVIARFYGNTNRGNRMCRNALRQCNFEIRRRGWWDARCLQVRNPW